jgi:hypothetical protein
MLEFDPQGSGTDRNAQSMNNWILDLNQKKKGRKSETQNLSIDVCFDNNVSTNRGQRLRG